MRKIVKVCTSRDNCVLTIFTRRRQFTCQKPYRQAYISVFGELIPVSEEEAEKLKSTTKIIYK